MDLLTQLKRDEDVKLTPYRDSVGKLTIGIGRNLDDVGLSMDEVEYLFANDIAKVKLQVAKNLPWTARLDLVRLGVLLNMAFNLGIGGLLQFKNTLALIQAGNYAAAADEMLHSEWASQVGERAIRLSVQLRTGEWQ